MGGPTASPLTRWLVHNNNNNEGNDNSKYGSIRVKKAALFPSSYQLMSNKQIENNDADFLYWTAVQQRFSDFTNKYAYFFLFRPGHL